MSYKVFLVEDEIVTREGIRENVDWGAAGFEFCGDAADGEIALPLIEESKPDVLITDIKMPFMDGLQLSKIVRERMPWIKIIILSGHNEFDYAQTAVKLGVTDYLLKPVSAQDINKTLVELSRTLERESQEREKLIALQNKVEDNLVLSRERFLLKLVMGGISSAEAITQSQQLGLDIVARYYLVVLLRIELCQDSQPFDYQEYQQVEQIITELVGNNLDVFLTKKDLEELVLLIRCDSLEQLVEEGEFLVGLIKNEVENRTTCNIVIGVGSHQERLSEVHHSFAEALVISKLIESSPTNSQNNMERVDQLKMDHVAIENYIKFGTVQKFDDFFFDTLQPIVEIAQESYIAKHYLFVDIILTATQFVSNLGEEAEELAQHVHEIERILNQLTSIEQIKEELRRIFVTAIAIRNNQTDSERILVLQQAKAYLDEHFADPELKMPKVAQKFNISPNHFSTIFHQEFGTTFRDYLGKLRINRAKELLRTTDLKCSEVAYQSGFNDPHYFSFVFKKKTGLTPLQFRSKVAGK